MPIALQRAEESLDPDDWQALARLGHRMVDDMIEHMRTARERPAWKPIPDSVKGRLQAPLPIEPTSAEEIYDEYRALVQPFLKGNTHPRFWGWVEGTGSALGTFAEMLAASLNSNCNFGEQAPTYVELQVLAWCKELFGYPAEASGLLVTGGSEANLLGLAIVRNALAGFDVARDGLHQDSGRLKMYGSVEMHSSVEKALELLGLGSRALRKIPVDGNFRIDLAALQAAIAEDRAAGYWPVCVIGNAGTVGTGAIDDLEALADVCEQEKLWFHVDGAFGALTALVPELRSLVAGIERSDSLAFDFHKWLGVPYAAACILTRHPEAHHGTFAHAGPYLSHMTRGVGAGPIWFSEWGIDLSRPFQALKIWMLFKEHGVAKYGRIIRQNIEQAAYLGQLIAANSRLELLAPIPLNVVCFRYRDPALNEDQLEALNREILVQLHESGDAIPSFTTIRGKYAIRVAIVNHRSRREDFDLLVERVIGIGDACLRSPAFLR